MFSLAKVLLTQLQCYIYPTFQKMPGTISICLLQVNCVSRELFYPLYSFRQAKPQDPLFKLVKQQSKTTA